MRTKPIQTTAPRSTDGHKDGAVEKLVTSGRGRALSGRPADSLPTFSNPKPL